MDPAAGSRDPATGADTVDGVILDGTESHRLARETAEREQLFQSLVQSVSGAIYRYSEHDDGEWRFTCMSPAIERLTGYPPEFFTDNADPCSELAGPGGPDQVRFHRRRLTGPRAQAPVSHSS